MAGKDIIAMTQEELKRLHIAHKAIDKAITQAEAAGIIGVCVRQAQRIVKAVREEGDQGIIHKGRGKSSNRALPGKVRDKALKLYREKYPDFGPTLASEKLFEINKIKLNDETLRLWLIEENIPYKKRKARAHRKWRQRKACCGEMIQIDGSEHDWFEGRGPECVFMGYIDDATGRPFGRFHPYEGTLPAMDSFKRYIRKYGIPASIYLDKHTTYKASKKPTVEDELLNKEALSQFGKALEELGVHLIHAQSAPAKGRVERLFKTFQDRLIKEMRLRKIKTIAEGNEFLSHYLPIFNKRFNVVPLQDEDLHRPLPKGIKLDKILSVKTPHALRNDFTVAHEGKLYQVEDNIRAKEVFVEERINGSLFITHKGRALRYREITQRPKRFQEPHKLSKPRVYTPAAMDNPWRMFRLPGSHKTQINEEVLTGAL